jgi:hypothetical protein
MQMSDRVTGAADLSRPISQQGAAAIWNLSFVPEHYINPFFPSLLMTPTSLTPHLPACRLIRRSSSLKATSVYVSRLTGPFEWIERPIGGWDVSLTNKII